MALRIKDLASVGDRLNHSLERSANERGRHLADSLLASTARGRGLWVIILWPAWLAIFLFSGVFCEALLRKVGVASPLSWAGLIGGLVVARAWYGADFTIRHPFWGGVLGYLATVFAVMFLAREIGL